MTQSNSVGRIVLQEVISYEILKTLIIFGRWSFDSFHKLRALTVLVSPRPDILLK